MGKMVAAVEEMLQSVGWSAQGLQLTMHELVVVLVVVQLVRTLHRFRPFVIVMLQGYACLQNSCGARLRNEASRLLPAFPLNDRPT
eukprot:m.133851 g.133851  ORF g.133851 m.133851 type:complete len:86 (-) comp16897_c1_seq3:53-310(-)